jgi:hypothetical protein
MTVSERVFDELNTVSALFLDMKSSNSSSVLMSRLKIVGLTGNISALIFYLVSSRELEANH